jgi:hypothetical protein
MCKKILINPSIFFSWFRGFEPVFDIFAKKLAEDGAEKVEISFVHRSSDLQSDPEADMNILFEVPNIFCPSDQKWREEQCQPNEVIVWLDDADDWGNIAKRVAGIVAHTAGGTDPYYRWGQLWGAALREGR